MTSAYWLGASCTDIQPTTIRMPTYDVDTIVDVWWSAGSVPGCVFDKQTDACASSVVFTSQHPFESHSPFKCCAELTYDLPQRL
jgi:hypothetical protein